MAWVETWLKSGLVTVDPEEDADKGGYPVRRPKDSELFMVHSTPRVPPTVISTHRPGDEFPKLQCSGPSIAVYAIIPVIISCICIVFGVFYCFFGYRYFKATMFLSGFLFGALVTYVICLEENLLPFEGKIGVAAGAGILCGLITMLVQYVGVFLTGFHLGFLGAVAGLSVAELFAHASSKWTPISSVFGAGLVSALLALRFQRISTVFATAAIGSTMMAAGVDHFVQESQMLMYVVDRLKAVLSEEPLCWYGWAVVAIGPSGFLVGIIVQFCITGKGQEHNKGRSNKRQHRVTLRHTSRESESRDMRPANYRHLYQIRRFNGDVIAQIETDMTMLLQMITVAVSIFTSACAIYWHTIYILLYGGPKAGSYLRSCNFVNCSNKIKVKYQSLFNPE